MINLILNSLLLLTSVTGQYDTQLINEGSTIEYPINFVDDNTQYSNGYYLDANDFSIPIDKQTHENMDILSDVKVWSEQTGEEFDYETAVYEDDNVTYTFNDMSLTVEYDVLQDSSFTILDTSTYFAQATYFNFTTIVIISIITFAFVSAVFYFLIRRFNWLIKNITDLF